MGDSASATCALGFAILLVVGPFLAMHGAVEPERCLQDRVAAGAKELHAAIGELLVSGLAPASSDRFCR